MPIDIDLSTDRRAFLTRTAAGAAIAALGAVPSWATATPPAPTPGIDSHAEWVRSIRTKYRQFFETGKLETFVPFMHVANYYQAWRATPGVGQNDMTAVLAIFGFAVPAVF